VLKRLSKILMCAVTVAASLILVEYLADDPCERQSSIHMPISGENRFFSICRDRIYLTDEDHDHILLVGPDDATFSVLPFFFAKDKEHVYYVTHGNDLLGGSEVNILPGADPASFEVVDIHVSKDAKHTYRFPYPPRSDIATDIQIMDNTTP